MEILMGILSGIFSGAGMGGGTILILLLTIVVGIDQHVAQGANLIFFIPTSLVAILVNYKNKNIDLKLAFYISIFGIIGAVIGANISTNINVNILRKYFGIFLFIITIYEIYSIIRKYKKEKINNNKKKER